MFFLKQIADCLLGEDPTSLWLTEFYGDCELELAKAALQKAEIYKTVAYVGDFAMQKLCKKGQEFLILKPDSVEQAVLMSQEMLKTEIVNLVIIDSLFLLPNKNMRFEKGLVCLVKAAEENRKPVFLLNPDNGARKLLQKSLKAFCRHQIQIWAAKIDPGV